MAKLTSGERKALPASDFALGKGHYPIEDKAHARNALARVSQFGSSSEKAKVRAKVRAKYPGIGQKSKKSGFYGEWLDDDPTVAAVAFLVAHPDWEIVLDDDGNVQLLVAPGYTYIPEAEGQPDEG